MIYIKTNYYCILGTRTRYSWRLSKTIKFEYKGIWWLPSKPKEQVSGTLRFSPDEGAILDLIGSFKDIQDFNQILNPEVILGVSSDGKNITLYKCFETTSGVSLPGFLTSSFYASVVFVDVHFEKTEDVKFESLSIHYSHLDDWANISGFDIPRRLSDKKEFLIKYKWPESVQVTISDDLKISIVVQVDFPAISVVQKEACIKQKTFIKIEPSKAKPLEQYWNIMYHTQNFLSLGVMEPVHPLAIKGITEAHKIIVENKTYYSPISIFYKVPAISLVFKPIMPLYMLFTFKDISENFEVFLRNWFEKAEMLKPVYDLYFGTLYNPHMYLQHKFLSLVHAIESYHRRTVKNCELPEDKHQKRVTEILDVVPSNYRRWLEWKLKYSNEPPLRQRLEDILGAHSEVLDAFMGDMSSFVDKTVDTRNYLTHYDPTLKERSADGEELYRLTQKLKALLEICLLKELGFSSDSIRSLISRNIRYRHEFYI